jgi:thymidylate kinase
MVRTDRNIMKIEGQHPRFIYITGCDGTGKSTQTSLLLFHLRGKGIQTQHVWLRFPFFLSVPLLVYARFRGYSWYEKVGNVRHGYWDFRRSTILRLLLPWTLLFDAAFAGFFKIYLPMWCGTTIVCERFVLDMLVDLAVAGVISGFQLQPPVNLYLKLLPKNAMILILTLDYADTVRQRRPDLKSDWQLEKRLDAFRLLAEQLGYPMISSQPSIKEVAHQILRIVECAS